ncbi:MAG: hypothetical protein KDK97_15210 [Verrucomicrobiales bacterium]|nr:hypothetical protein [Verrucomicrobiales bacterium]MCP5560497.1 hypothetical protein [Verrucomicrobiaceae bacterium]
MSTAYIVRWIIWTFVAVCVVVWGYYVLPEFVTPSGVWERRIVRDHPLTSPIPVSAVEGTTLITPVRKLVLAGVFIPDDESSRLNADVFLKATTAKGVEIIQEIENATKQILRCEVRLYHWCGNDSIDAHFEQHNLNEMMIGLGYAKFDHETKGLSADEWNRFAAAEKVAKKMALGVWGDAPAEPNETLARSGFSVSSPILGLDFRIRVELSQQHDRH